jgi:predicted metal-dependent hydrolase
LFSIRRSQLQLETGNGAASVIEYVVIHELCHLKELNHSKAFWGLVQRHCPDWRAQRKWLRDNEAALSF